MLNLLLQTTIETDPDDWAIARFSRLGAFLAALRDGHGRPAFRVTARDRAPRGQPDPVLSALHESDFDQLWLFAVDTGDGLAPEDCASINQFWRRGGGLIVMRDHMDLGSSIRGLHVVGTAHHFHSHNREADAGRHRGDDPACVNRISWPNYNSGRNGDFQRIRSVGSIHPVMRDRWSTTGVIQYLPAHPHEGTVSAPPGNANSRVIMEGQSVVSGRRFNIAVAFERCEHSGRAIAQSTFHHFADYNWDPAAGCPSFVTESPGDGMVRSPGALRSTQQYVRNIASWLTA